MPYSALDAEEGEGLAEAAGHLLGGLARLMLLQPARRSRLIAMLRIVAMTWGRGAGPHLGAVLVVGTVPDVARSSRKEAISTPRL